MLCGVPLSPHCFSRPKAPAGQWPAAHWLMSANKWLRCREPARKRPSRYADPSDRRRRAWIRLARICRYAFLQATLLISELRCNMNLSTRVSNCCPQPARALSQTQAITPLEIDPDVSVLSDG